MQAFPQAPVKAERRTKYRITKTFYVDQDRVPQYWVLKLLIKIYGQLQAGKVLHLLFTKGLIYHLGFEQLRHNPYFYG